MYVCMFCLYVCKFGMYPFVVYSNMIHGIVTHVCCPLSFEH